MTAAFSISDHFLSQGAQASLPVLRKYLQAGSLCSLKGGYLQAGSLCSLKGRDSNEITQNGILGASDYHVPVLPEQTLNAFTGKERLIVDATAGGGGHSELLLKAGHKVIALDRDLDSLEQTADRLGKYGDSFMSIHANFSSIDEALESKGIQKVDGILADFGVSSHQLDEAERGFSFMRSGPLDMRMNQSAGMTAKEIVHTYSESELVRIFWEYGEEKSSRKIARCITEVRGEREFTTTLDLANFILERGGKREKIPPATRVFQALRIEVNNELGEIQDLLRKAPALLHPEGRLALISFHSLEDRMVKRFFSHHSAETLDRPEWPAPKPNPDYCLKTITKKPLMADAGECKLNPRARTAKLRVAERI